MTMFEAWSFLISRSQFLDYRTVVAPSFMCEAGATSILAKAAEGDLTDSGVAYYREVHGSKVGELTLVFRVIEATSENTEIESNGTLKDAFGREIFLIEGVVLKGIVQNVFVSQPILDKIHLELVKHYQEFWSQTTSQPATASELFTFSSEGLKLEYKALKEYGASGKILVYSQTETPIDTENSTEQQSLWQSSPTESCPSEVVSIACSSDGSLIAFRYDRTVIVRNLRTQQTDNLYSERKILGNFPVPLVFSRDGQLLATGVIEAADQNTVKVWNINTKQEFSFHGHKQFVFGRIRAIAITPNNEMVISGGDDGIKIWDIKSGEEFGDFLEHSSSVKAIAISKDGKTVISGEIKGVIKIWNLRSRRAIQSLQAHSLPINSLAISPDGRLVASCSDDYSIKLWNFKTGSEICVLGQHSAPVNSVAFSSNGKLVVSGADDHRVKVWELSSRKSIAVLAGHSSSVTSVAFIPGEQTIISGSRDCTMRRWHRT